MRLLTSEHMSQQLAVVARVGAEAVHHMLELSVVPVLKVLTAAMVSRDMDICSQYMSIRSYRQEGDRAPCRTAS